MSRTKTENFQLELSLSDSVFPRKQRLGLARRVDS